MVKLKVRCETKFGESLAVIGSAEALGKWKKDKFAMMGTDEGSYPTWSVDLDIPEGEEIEYKYILVRGDGSIKRWELEGSRNNRKLLVSKDVPEKDDGKFNELPNSKKAPGGGYAEPTGPDTVSVPPADSNERRASKVPVDGGKFLQNLASESAVSKSWRKRLSYIRRLFTDPGFARDQSFDPKNMQHLAIVVIYLTFVGSGQIKCEEDGSHYRPNHHANESRQIDDALVKLTDGRNAHLIRKIYPVLPSYRSAFTASVPLTRIRDIAHRNDIPHELKQEIKHTLQNKLHRSAGPEDLVNSENMLKRITAPGANYSGAFVHEFQIFFRELKEFFNATDLDDGLDEMRRNCEPRKSSMQPLEKFQRVKEEKRPAIEQLEALVALRREICDAMKSMEGGEVLQRVRLTDIQLEKFAFVLLAGVNSEPMGWDLALHGAALALESVELSGVAPEEAGAVRAELNAISNSDQLRLKAALERCVRFCDDFSRQTTDLFEGMVDQVGRTFHVDQHAINVFVEAEIRSNVVFQLSRLASWGMRTVRSELGQPPWDVLFPGVAVGSLLFAKNIASVPERELGRPRVAVLEEAEGDEDIPESIKGVVLGHDLPHLSHLGVRARQAKVVFINSEDRSAFDGFCNGQRGLDGQTVQLTVKLDGEVLKLERHDDVAPGDTTEASAAPATVTIAEPDLKMKTVVTPDKASKAAAGTKSNSAGELEQSAKKLGGFKTPRGLVLPFSAFTQALKEVGDSYTELTKGFDSLSLEAKEERAEEITNFILDTLPVSAEITNTVQKTFGRDSRLMVRSSANCEDLEDMSGAGLYDSFANVDAADADDIETAIRKVWGSLWTKRAALSRSQYKIPHDKALMAVLIQQMLDADVSFIMFSNNPINGSENEVYIEMAVGMGETLASAGSRGSPYRLVHRADEDQVEVLSLASFSNALVPGVGNIGLEKKVIDYSGVQMTKDRAYREKLTRQLAKVARALEGRLGGPQDIEGVIKDGEIYLVQSRPMVK